MCFVIFFPLFFLTDAVIPKGALTGWFSTIATYNPVTYLPRCAAIADHHGMGRHDAARRRGRHGRHRLPQHVARLPGAAGEGPAAGTEFVDFIAGFSSITLHTARHR